MAGPEDHSPPAFVPSRPKSATEQLFLERFDRHAASLGEKTALIHGRTTVSWRKLQRQANRIAEALIDAGGTPGDRAAIASRGSADYVATFIGILKARMSAVPLSTMANAELLAKLVKDSGASFLFADNHAVELLDGQVDQDCLAIAYATAPSNWLDFADWSAGESTNAPRNRPMASDEFNIIYSSGTTGTPKGIVHDHALRAIQVNAFEAFGLSPQSTTIITTALYSNYSLVALLATLGAGGTVLLMTKFDERAFLSACAEHEVTHSFLVPEQITRLLAHPDFDKAVSGTRMTVLSAGSPLPAARKREVLERWPGLLLEIYGATEGGASTVLVATQFPDKLGSVGTPSEGCDIRIVAEDGSEAAQGEPGEIVGRSATMMQSYLNRDAETVSLVWTSPDGKTFMRSGDIGYFDDDGFLYLSDRKKDVIISGGMNVYASDIEEVFRAHPAVTECAVVAGPSERWGETPVAFVIPGKHAPGEDSLRGWANARLSKHQKISQLLYRPELPRNDMGKIIKKELRRQLESN